MFNLHKPIITSIETIETIAKAIIITAHSRGTARLLPRTRLGLLEPKDAGRPCHIAFASFDCDTVFAEKKNLFNFLVLVCQRVKKEKSF